MTVAAKHSGLGRGFGELFQRTDLDDDDEERLLHGIQTFAVSLR